MTKTTDIPSRLHQCTRRSPSARAAALLATALLCAGTAAAATLGEIYAMALQSDATFAAAKAAATAAREKRVQGRANILPTVNLTGSVKHVQESTTAIALYEAVRQRPETNVMEPVMEAVIARATLQEICDAMRRACNFKIPA